MNYRVLIFDDEMDIRQILWLLFDNRGYEVFTFPHPDLCPISMENYCPCPDNYACADIIIADVNMPYKNGVNFIKEQIKKGCRCKNIALMSGAFTDQHIAKANELGIEIFKKPFQLEEINNWLDRVEKGIDPQRKLSDWFLNKINDKK